MKFKSLKTKIILSVSMLILIVCIGLALIAYNLTYAALKNNIDSSMEKISVQAAATISARSETIAQSLDSLGTNPIFHDIKTNQASILSFMGQEAKSKGHLFLAVADKDGNTLSDQNLGNIAKEDYFKKAIQGNTVITDPIINQTDKSMRIYIVVPVKDDLNQVCGALIAARDGTEPSDLVADVTYGKTGKAFMLNGQGVTVAHSNHDLVLKQDNDFENIKTDPALASLVALEKDMVAGKSGTGQYNYNGIVKYMAYTPVKGTGWFLALTAPESEVFESVKALGLFILIAGAAFLALGIFVSVLFARSIIGPVKQTAVFAEQLAQGKTDAIIKMKSNDEVGQLVKILDTHVRQAFIKDQQAKIIAQKQAVYRDEHADKLVVNLQRLSEGELYCDMEVEAPDTDTQDLYDLFNGLKENLHTTTETIKGYIKEISEVLGSLSSGDLTVDIQSEYKGDFIELKDSINNIALSMKSVMTEISAAADQVAAGTDQVSAGSQAISQGAAEQASSIEELSASIDTMADQTKQNAMSANKANEITSAAREHAVTGNGQMEHMLSSMEAINESSQNISKIIKVIDDIAFQTNILALNAAVEAARAGVHGKGFAVVAEEVRNLATKSASAAKETTALIEDSIKKVEGGTSIANETAAALFEIVSGTEKAVRLSEEIAASSSEQATAISQIDKGIEQLSLVVQTNSATAEEAASASEELSGQAELLKSMVKRFKTN